MTKMTRQKIDALMDSADVQEHVFFGKALVAAYRIPSRGGFVLVGMGACIAPENFDYEIGRLCAREQVADQLWQLESYLSHEQNADSLLVPEPLPDPSYLGNIAGPGCDPMTP